MAIGDKISRDFLVSNRETNDFLHVSGAAREERYEECTIMTETKLINNGISSNFVHVPDCHLTPLISCT